MPTMTMDVDRVFEQARDGDEAAFSVLVRRHEREIQQLCTRMLRCRHRGEDVTQEAFLRAWRSLPRFEGRSTFRTWLYRIAVNACLDALRRPPELLLDGDRAGPLEPMAPRSSEPEGVVVTKATVEMALAAATELLSPTQRTVLIMREAMRWSAAETAEMLQTSVSAVNSSLQRARATLSSPDAARVRGRLGVLADD
jgi:RNA polymerase sigma-70 factor (ECF subfamily)